ncbi:Transketolase protein [Neisseria sp. oral taxon 020 str. F0370]|nr:Transketolase protein [Neisseria sp. oral taxon 020 str. F0370]
MPVGKGIIRRQGKCIAVLAFGSMVAPALEAAETLDATVADMRFVKPLDKELVLQLADSHDYLVCAEENAVCGGAGSAVLEMLAAEGRLKPVLLIGIPDTVTDHGDPKLLLDKLGLSAERLAERIAAFAREAV